MSAYGVPVVAPRKETEALLGITVPAGVPAPTLTRKRTAVAAPIARFPPAAAFAPGPSRKVTPAAEPSARSSPAASVAGPAPSPAVSASEPGS